MEEVAVVPQRDEALGRLRAILQVNGELAQFDPFASAHTPGGPSGELHVVLGDIVTGAGRHRERLSDILRRWEARPSAHPRVSIRTNTLSFRDLVESWVAIKESSAEMYRDAAAVAPDPLMSEELLALASEEDGYARRLRELL